MECEADSKQYCGGPTDDHLQFYVATCEAGSRRFGESCYKELDVVDKIESQADKCYKEVKG